MCGSSSREHFLRLRRDIGTEGSTPFLRSVITQGIGRLAASLERNTNHLPPFAFVGCYRFALPCPTRSTERPTLDPAILVLGIASESFAEVKG